MMMKKKLVVLIAAMTTLVMAATAMAAAGKIAYVDSQQVYDKTTLGKQYQDIVREYYESRKKILDMDAQDIQKLQDDYGKQKQAMLPKAQKEKEEAIGRKISEYQKKRDEFSSEIAKKNEELSNDFNEEMVVVIKAIAKKDSLSMILNKNINILSRTEVPAILYADEELDLTGEVIKEMDKKAAGKK
jgi:outer membrane protein